MSGDVPRRKFGRHDEEVSLLCLGGYHIGAIGTKEESIRVMHAAIDAGVTFFDNAWEYHDGKSEERMGEAIADRRDRVFLMTKVCTHGRDAKTAMRQLDESLRRLKTDYLDLWQIHECIYATDPELHFAAGGAIEAVERAKREGKVRYIGFTGHKDPDVHLEMLSHNFPFDSCQLPLNGFDAGFRSFERRVLPELLRQGIAPLGMKPLGAGDPIKKKAVTAHEALRYAMSLPVATVVCGMDSMHVLRENIRYARDFQPMSAEEMDAYRVKCAGDAADGRFELYKTTASHDGDVGRKQHGFPTSEEVPG